MKSRRRGLGRSSPVKVAICLEVEGKRRILKRGLMPRKSLSLGSKSSQGRLRISGTSEAMTRNRRAPTGTAAVIFSQDEASQRSKSCFPRAFWAPASFSGLQPCSKRAPKLRESSRTALESDEERHWLLVRGVPSRKM